MEQAEVCRTAGSLINWWWELIFYNYFGKLTVSTKAEHIVSYHPAILSLSTFSTRYLYVCALKHDYKHVYSSTAHNSQALKTTQMDKNNLNGILYRAMEINELMLLEITWINFTNTPDVIKYVLYDSINKNLDPRKSNLWWQKTLSSDKREEMVLGMDWALGAL